MNTKGVVPKPRQFHTGVVYKNCLYVTGGFAMNSNHQEFLEYNFGCK